MTQTTIVGGLGLFVFALSTFTPTQRFGTLMLVMLLAALAGDLILLPALLAGPAGRFFKPRDQCKPKATKPNRVSAAEQNEPVEKDLVTHPADLPSNAPAAEEEENAVPHLRLHFPRRDPAHRIKRSQ